MQKILAIDDKKDNLISVSALLNRLVPFVTVLTSQSGVDGIKMAQTELPDTILLDIIMPEMDGFEVCKRLKSDEKTKHIPIIMLTAIKTDSKSRVKGFEIGADAFLSKPIDEAELAAQVKVMLRIKTAEDQLRKEKELLEDTVSEKTKGLLESEERFRIALQNSKITVHNQDRDLRYTWVYNPHPGLLDESVIGKTDEDLIPGEESEILTKIKRRVLKSGCGEREIVRFTVGDKPSFYDLTVEPLIDTAGNIKGITGTAADITVLKETEVALRESEDKLLEAQKIAKLGHYVFDIKSGSWTSSPGLDDIFGTDENYKKDVAGWLQIVHPDSRETISNYLADNILVQHQKFDKEYKTINLKSREERWVHGLGSLKFDENNNPVELFGTTQDITETKRLQTQLLESQKMESIATLAGGIAHEFNNALTGIVGSIELLKMRFPEEQDMEKYFEIIKNASQRMSNHTDHLLAYAEGGKYQPTEISVSGLIRDTLSILKFTLSPAIAVETDLSRDIFYIKADTTQLQMVLLTILNNSNEAMGDEGRITITVKNKDLDDEFTKQYQGLAPGPYVCLRVEDDGTGMDEKTRDRIFDPFFTTKVQGRGMGMAAVHGIVRNHNGLVTVDSELGKGTVVTIWLPAIEFQAEEKIEKSPQQPLGTGTVLVIDDDEDVMNITRAFLMRLGYGILEAKTGKEGVEIARTFDGDIDLVLLDIKLPDIQGDKVYPLIMEARPDLKVIVFSGYSIDGPARKILNAGAQDFIQKPFLFATLSEKLQKVLEGKQAIKLG